MPRFEKSENKTDGALGAFDRASDKSSGDENSGDKTARGFDWFGANFVNPLVNTLCVEPANAITQTVERAAGQLPFHRVEPLPVPDTSKRPISTELVSQSVACAIGSVGPYALAGMLAGNAMRCAGAALKTEGAIATFAQNDKVAQIVGAGVYDGMKETRQGETHLRNGIAGAASFAVLEYSRVDPRASLIGRSLDRFSSGFVGSLTHVAISRPDVFSLKAPSDINISSSLLTGALINVLLPGTQQGLRMLQEKASLRMGRGIPIDRYLSNSSHVNAEAINARAEFTSATTKKLFEQNRWARIEPDSKFDCYLPKRDMVSLTSGSSRETLLHELHHRKEALAGIAEPGFVQAAAYLNKDVNRAWQIFARVRRAQEIRAEIAGRQEVNSSGLTSKAEFVNELKRTLPSARFAGGDSYIQLWRREFEEFLRSGGKFRPEADYSKCRFNKEIRDEANRLYVRLAGREPNAGNAIDGVIERHSLNDEQVLSVFKHVNEFLKPKYSTAVQLPLPFLAMQTLRLVARPEKVKQGFHPTCGPAALEYATYVKHPENAASLISQVALTGKYKSADGTSITLDLLNVIPERTKTRSFANQLFQTTSVNVHWQRKTSLEPWLYSGDGIDNSITAGAIRYERQPHNSSSPDLYRLMDYSKKPVRPLQDRLAPELRNDMADPLMDCNSLNDINGQINGGTHGDIALPWDLHSQQVLERTLRERHLTGRLPVLTVIDCRHPLFRHGMEDPLPDVGWHIVAVRGYDPATKTASIFNPWGHILNGISTRDLYKANKEFKISTENKSL